MHALILCLAHHAQITVAVDDVNSTSLTVTVATADVASDADADAAMPAAHSAEREPATAAEVEEQEDVAITTGNAADGTVVSAGGAAIEPSAVVAEDVIMDDGGWRRISQIWL
jgi:hypothetical protein